MRLIYGKEGNEAQFTERAVGRPPWDGESAIRHGGFPEYKYGTVEDSGESKDSH